MTDDDAWPTPRTTLLPPRVKVRLACSLVVAVVFVVAFDGYLLEVLPRLWPPWTPTSRWVTLVLLQAFGFVLVPVSVGSYVGDLLYDRYYVSDA